MKLTKIISGENINLCEPNEKFALHSDWYDWFNDPNNTKYLDRGLIKNTPTDQVNFFKSITDRVVFIIQEKNNDYYIGVVSLSNINYQKKTCELAIVRDLKKNKLAHFFSSLEAISLITEYAFEKLDMRIICAVQHIELDKWQNQMELAGYKLDGILKNKFYKFGKESDIMSISCHVDDYNFLKTKRKKYWDGNALMYSRYKKLLKIENFSSKLSNFLGAEKDVYYKKIYEL